MQEQGNTVVHGRVHKRGPARVHPAIRLLGLLVSTPDDPNACWTTTATNSKRPLMHLGGGKYGARSRVALASKLGRDLGEGMQALHTCDNPACVRPDHLFEGTHLDNMHDMERKGRRYRKLSSADVDAIRSLASQGHSHTDIGKTYGVTHSWVSYIVRGEVRRSEVKENPQ